MGGTSKFQIRVGHVDVDDLWVDIDTNSSLTVQEVITKSGLKPRDGTPVHCYKLTGERLHKVRIIPGSTILIGARAPKIRITDSLGPKAYIIRTKWERKTPSGVIGSATIKNDNCTIWIPGIGKERCIRVVELFRKENKLGKIHANGYRIRGNKVPYLEGDIVQIIHQEHVEKRTYRLFDPLTEKLSIPVYIHKKSLNSALNQQRECGFRKLWAIEIVSFDLENRSATARVHLGNTWY